MATLLLLVVSAHAFAQQERKQAAEALVEKGEYRKAIQIYRSLLVEYPDDIESKKRLALLFGYTGEYDRSIALSGELLERFPGDADIRFRYAQVLSWKGDYSAAEAQYHAVLNESPGYRDARLGLARVYFWQDRYGEALNTLEPVVGSAPEDPVLLELLVEIHYSRGDTRAAKRCNQMLLNIAPDSDTGRRYRSLLLMYSVEFRGGYDRVSGRDDWKEGALSLTYEPDERFTGIVQWASFSRFGLQDHQAALDTYTKFGKFNIHLFTGFGIEREFIPDQRYQLELSYSAGRFVGYGGGQFLRFDAEDVKIALLGFDYYFPGSVYIDYKYYYSEGEFNNTSDTHVSRLHLYRDYRYHVYAGYASGGEAYQFGGTEDLLFTESRSYLAGAEYYVRPAVGVRAAFSYIDRKNSYTRTSFNGGLFVRF